MITGIRKIVGLLVLLLAASLAFAVPVNRKPQTPQKGRPQVKAPTPIFTSQVEMVTVDAVVVDKKGRPLTDLRREDFIVYEDDVPQPITSFEAIQVPERPTEKPPAPSRVASNTGQQVRAGRTFAILFDDIHLDHFQARRAQMAVAEFLRVGVRDGDRITLASASGSVYWSTRMLAGREELMTLLKRMEGRLIPDVMAQDRITDYEAMRITEYKDTLIADRVYRRFEASGVLQRQAGSNSSSSSDEETSTDSSGSLSRDGGLGMTDPYITSRALEVYQQATSRNRITLDAIERVVKSLTALKGRKGLILVSQGFIHDPTLFNFKDVIEAARRSNVTLYYVDTRGLSGEMPFFSAEFSGAIDVQDLGPLFADQNQESQGAEYLATESGGFFVKDTNDLGAGITRIADEARAYFLLGYNPPTAAKDGRFHRIQVRCNRKNTTVRARKGYFAPLEGQAKKLKPGEADPEIQQAIDSPFEIEGIPLRLSAYAFEETLIGKSRVVVVADAHIYNLAFEEKEGRLTDSLDMLMVAVHRETGEVFQYSQQIDMKLRPETREKAPWYPIVREFELSPGMYQIRMVVRDQNSRRVGSVLYSFEVPDPGIWHISSPVVSDTLMPNEPGDSTPHPQPIARRQFLGSGTLYCQYEVFNAAKDLSTTLPRVAAHFVVTNERGEVVRRSEPSTIIPTTEGRVTRLIGFPLESLPPGNYELALLFRDEVSQQSIEHREPFSVEVSSAQFDRPR